MLESTGNSLRMKRSDWFNKSTPKASNTMSSRPKSDQQSIALGATVDERRSNGFTAPPPSKPGLHVYIKIHSALLIPDRSRTCSVTAHRLPKGAVSSVRFSLRQVASLCLVDFLSPREMTCDGGKEEKKPLTAINGSLKHSCV